MNDLISLAALFNALSNVKTIEEAFAVIQGMPAAARWIPCEERRPEEKQDVLLAFKKNMIVGFWENVCGDVTWYANSGDGWMTGTESVDNDGIPIAWMPLPEPWREDA